MYFTENRYDRSIESMMKGIPNFYPRGSGVVVTGKFEYTADMCDCRLCEHYGGKLKACNVPRCVCLEERIAVGVASIKEVMKETMSEIKHSGFLRRLRRYIKESEVIPMTFLSEQHRLSFNAALDRIGKYDTKNYALVAPLYLLTADLRLWNQTRRYFENHGISFGKLRPKNCSEHSYPLYCAAKDLYLGTKHITINDLADNKLINVKPLRSSVTRWQSANSGWDQSSSPMKRKHEAKTIHGNRNSSSIRWLDDANRSENI